MFKCFFEQIIKKMNPQGLDAKMGILPNWTVNFGGPILGKRGAMPKQTTAEDVWFLFLAKITTTQQKTTTRFGVCVC